MTNTGNTPENHQKHPQDEALWCKTLLDLARFLRSPKGCPWDRKQKTQDFAKYAHEEAAELLEACAANDNAEIQEEWGDTFFTLLACAAAAEEEGRFNLAEAIQKAHEKMVRRHAHIFGDKTAETPEEVLDLWNKIKAQEKQAKNKSSQD